MSKPTLDDLQQVNIERALKAPARHWVFADEMGVGKSRQALKFLQLIGAERVLFVVPALVRTNWEREIGKWWDHAPQVGKICYGPRKGLSKKKKAALEAAIEQPARIVSYNMLDAPWLDKSKLDAIVYDEAHLLQSPNSGWSKAARALVAQNPKAAILGLTGTMLPNQPMDAWNLVDTVWPGRFGDGWQTKDRDRDGREVKGRLHPNWTFSTRYAQSARNEYGVSFFGVADEYSDELRMRIAAMTSRITRKDIAHLLPPYQTRVVEVDDGENRIKASAKWAKEALATSSHIAIATHLRSTVEQLYAGRAAFGTGTVVIAIDGSDTPEERVRKLDMAQQARSAVVVATMHSIGRGITLGWCQQILLAELYWRPETLVQFFGRVGRVGDASVGTVIDILVGADDTSRRMAFRLAEKLEAINKTVAAGAVESALSGAVGNNEQQLLAILNDMSDIPAAQQEDWIMSASVDDDPENDDILS